MRSRSVGLIFTPGHVWLRGISHAQSLVCLRFGVGSTTLVTSHGLTTVQYVPELSNTQTQKMKTTHCSPVTSTNLDMFHLKYSCIQATWITTWHKRGTKNGRSYTSV